MYVYDSDDIRRLLSNLVRCLESYPGGNTMYALSKQLKKYFLEDVSNPSEIFDEEICSLVELIGNPAKQCSVIILKNKMELFDMFIFEKEVSIALTNLASSESLEEMIRRNPMDGCVIENVSSDDILVFLKSYYIHRKEPSQSPTALNLVPEYDSECLEMASINDKFSESEPLNRIPLKYIILYDKEALPYHLGYLDNYKKEIKSSFYQYRFCDILKEVRQDRFLGTSLKKFQR